MIKNDTNNFFNDQETQDPLTREKLLFKDIGLKLKKITEKSVGWKNRLNQINFEKVFADLKVIQTNVVSKSEFKNPLAVSISTVVVGALVVP